MFSIKKNIGILTVKRKTLQEWFYQQIKKMGKGLMPDLDLKPWKAFREDTKEDQKATEKYKNFNLN